MGLDMYLNAKKHISKFDNDYGLAQELRNKLGIPSSENRESVKLSFEIAYWRKANQIHRWFVDNCGNGEDNGDPYYVSKEDLKQLLSEIKQTLANKELAETNLPTQEGFFFGSNEYDQYYWDALTSTEKKLEEILANKNLENFEFEYQASW